MKPRTLLILSTLTAVLTAIPAWADYRAAFDKGDFATALAEARPLAQKGDAAAQCYYGEMLAEGLGIKKDDKLAFGWFAKAAAQNYPKACFDLGYMYDHGRGAEQDNATAAVWYTKGAELGNVDAQYNLALMYVFGEGVAKDPVKACYWYGKAAEQGDAEAQYQFGLCYIKGEGIEQNNTKGVEWITKASHQNLPEAILYLMTFSPAKKD